MIPQEKIAAVTRGLREAFGVTEFDDIRQITKGRTSSLVFRIVVKGSPFVLKIIMRNEDSTRHFNNMKSAAEAGLAPPVRYISTEDRLAITDFIEETPFPLAEAVIRIPATLRALHALAPFTEVPNHINTSCMFLLNKGAAVDGFIQAFRTANILPPPETEELLARYAQLAAVYPVHAPDMVSSHNDLFKPDNMLFDGQRLWLVDWEAAFLNDRYADMAVVANLTVTNDAEERLYLKEYFGQPPDSYQLARFYLMQQVTHVFYSMAFLLAGFSGSQVDLTESTPDSGDFQRRFWTGEIALVDNQTKTAYGRLHWQHLKRNMEQARFHEAVRTVADRHPSPQTA